LHNPLYAPHWAGPTANDETEGAMATIKKPRGRMTKPLVTQYEVGDAC